MKFLEIQEDRKKAMLWLEISIVMVVLMVFFFIDIWPTFGSRIPINPNVRIIGSIIGAILFLFTLKGWYKLKMWAEFLSYRRFAFELLFYTILIIFLLEFEIILINGFSPWSSRDMIMKFWPFFFGVIMYLRFNEQKYQIGERRGILFEEDGCIVKKSWSSIVCELRSNKIFFESVEMNKEKKFSLENVQVELLKVPPGIKIDNQMIFTIKEILRKKIEPKVGAVYASEKSKTIKEYGFSMGLKKDECSEGEFLGEFLEGPFTFGSLEYTLTRLDANPPLEDQVEEKKV